MKSYTYRKNPHQKQSGYILATGLIFLLVATIASVATLQNSNINYQLSANQSYSEVAFYSSETGRIAVGNSIGDYMFYRSWEGRSINSELAILDKDSDSKEDSPLEDNGSTEDIYKTDTLITDAKYSWKSSTTKEDIKSDVFILSTTPILDSGAGAQQLAGYEGIGKGAGAGGGSVFFEIRSLGYGNSGAKITTASDYRAKIQ